MRGFILTVLLLACVLIAGCATQNPQAQAENSTMPTAPIANVSPNIAPNASTPAASPAPGIAQNASAPPANPAPNITRNLSVQTTPADSSGQNLSTDFDKVYSGDGKLMVYFFYSSTCEKCKIIAPFVAGIAEQYGNVTEWQDYDINGAQGRSAYFSFFKQMNLDQDRSGVPTILVNDTVLVGIYEINDSLEQIINGSIITPQ